MKDIKITQLTRRRLFILIVFISGSFAANSQDTTDEIKALLESKSFTFNAQTASPQKARTLQLDPGYTLSISNDTLNCDLPYFGRVYQAPMGSNDGGIKFQSHNFEYQPKPGKKGKWTVKLKTKDLHPQRDIYLTISPNGTATLSVSSMDRQSISYYGTVVNSKRQ